jgi:hypothetical protein
MEESKKKPIMIAVIVVCLAAAGAITWKTTSKKRYTLDEIPDDRMSWVKCRNPDCGAEYQIRLKDYYRYIEEHGDPSVMMVPALICKTCEEESVYAAVKCEKCETVFEKGWKRGDFEDRCPKCDYSKIETDRREAAARRRR